MINWYNIKKISELHMDFLMDTLFDLDCLPEEELFDIEGNKYKIKTIKKKELSKIIKEADNKLTDFFIIKDEIILEEDEGYIGISDFIIFDIINYSKKEKLSQVDVYILDSIFNKDLFFIDMFDNLITNDNVTKREKDVITLVKYIYEYAYFDKGVYMMGGVIFEYIRDMLQFTEYLENKNYEKIINYYNIALNIELEEGDEDKKLKNKIMQFIKTLK